MNRDPAGAVQVPGLWALDVDPLQKRAGSIVNQDAIAGIGHDQIPVRSDGDRACHDGYQAYDHRSGQHGDQNLQKPQIGRQGTGRRSIVYVGHPNPSRAYRGQPA